MMRQLGVSFACSMALSLAMGCSSSSSPSPTSGACAQLQACCSTGTLVGNELAGCSSVAQTSDGTACATALGGYVSSGRCSGVRDGGTGDGGGPTSTCSTTAGSVTFQVTGSCGAPGQITVSTMPGLCVLEVVGGPAVGLPNTGSFSAAAAGTGYQIGSGNWSLPEQSATPQADPSTIVCSITGASSPGALTADCTMSSCTPAGSGFQCTPSTCVADLSF
jgi:hypothetical protein